MSTPDTHADRPPVLPEGKTHGRVFAGHPSRVSLVDPRFGMKSPRMVAITLAGFATVTLLGGITDFVSGEYWAFAVALAIASLLALSVPHVLSGRGNLVAVSVGVAAYVLFAIRMAIPIILQNDIDVILPPSGPLFAVQAVAIIAVSLFSTSVGPLAAMAAVTLAATAGFSVITIDTRHVVSYYIFSLALFWALPLSVGLLLFRANQALHGVYQQQATFLREAHHRTKNQLSLLASIVNLEHENQSPRDLKEKLAVRFRAMAGIEHEIYGAQVYGSVPSTAHVERVVSGVKELFSDKRKKISYRLFVDEFELAIRAASKLGIILIELITNSYKHGFPARDIGSIEIRLKKIRGFIYITYRDDGVGFPEDSVPSQTDSLGFSLLETVVEEWGGRMSVSSNAGAQFEFTVPETALCPG